MHCCKCFKSISDRKKIGIESNDLPHWVYWAFEESEIFRNVLKEARIVDSLECVKDVT